eukprot:6316506-Pyramimonas_sp.AAC.1
MFKVGGMAESYPPVAGPWGEVPILTFYLPAVEMEPVPVIPVIGFGSTSGSTFLGHLLGYIIRCLL